MAVETRDAQEMSALAGLGRVVSVSLGSARGIGIRLAQAANRAGLVLAVMEMGVLAVEVEIVTAAATRGREVLGEAATMTVEVRTVGGLIDRTVKTAVGSMIAEMISARPVAGVIGARIRVGATRAVVLTPRQQAVAGAARMASVVAIVGVGRPAAVDGRTIDAAMGVVTQRTVATMVVAVDGQIEAHRVAGMMIGAQALGTDAIMEAGGHGKTDQAMTAGRSTELGPVVGTGTSARSGSFRQGLNVLRTSRRFQCSRLMPRCHAA
jgi:hypothetical protein